MKIAILFSGRINHYPRCYELIMQHIANNHDVDFFLSHPKIVDENELNGFNQLFKPKKIIRNDEIYPNIDRFNKRPETNRHNMMCMYLNRSKVFQLLEDYCNETNTQYDVIFSCRIDVMVFSPLNIDSFIENVRNNILFVPSGEDHLGINDRFAFGNFQVMKDYMNCYHSLLDLFQKGVIVHPETVLNHYLISKNMKIQRFNIHYDFLR